MIVVNPPQVGDPILRQKTIDVVDFSVPEIKEIIENLTDTMCAESLVGLAAPQIGESVSVFVTEIRDTRSR